MSFVLVVGEIHRVAYKEHLLGRSRMADLHGGERCNRVVYFEPESEKTERNGRPAGRAPQRKRQERNNSSNNSPASSASSLVHCFSSRLLSRRGMARLSCLCSHNTVHEGRTTWSPTVGASRSLSKWQAKFTREPPVRGERVTCFARIQVDVVRYPMWELLARQLVDAERPPVSRRGGEQRDEARQSERHALHRGQNCVETPRARRRLPIARLHSLSTFDCTRRPS